MAISASTAAETAFKLPDGISATEMSRIFGNYFIIEFVFNNLDGRRIDFEELNYSLSQN